MIKTAQDLARLVEKWGFLPFFENRLTGFSIKEQCDKSIWFVDGVDGPWEFKGPALRLSGGVYGKFFGGKAGFVSREWFYDFANMRRDGYDYDAAFNDGLLSTKDKNLVACLEENGDCLSYILKEKAGYGKDGLKGFDGRITRMQMRGYIVTTNFEYRTDKNGKPYGWGVARYATPEQYLGAGFSDLTYRRTPRQSEQLVIEQIQKILPDASRRQIEKFIK